MSQKGPSAAPSNYVTEKKDEEENMHIQMIPDAVYSVYRQV